MRHLTLVLALGIVLICSVTSYGKQHADKRSYQLDEITVTAQKRQEDPSKVPIAMDVFSDIFIEDSMMENTMELIRFSPNVYMKDSPYENLIVIRGMSSFSSSLYSPAAYYVNGVGYSMHYMHDNQLFDIERIEVLKGPQGTLYGRNSESGVISIITKQPDNNFRAKVLGEYGNYNSYRFNANVSGPIVEGKLFIGSALQYKYSDGYFENQHNGDDNIGEMSHFNGRATLRWTPSVPWDISLIVDMIKADDKVGIYRMSKGPHVTDPYKTRHDETDQYFTENGNSQVFKINYKSDAYAVTSVTGATFRTYSKFNDTDMWDNPSRKMTNEYTYDNSQYSQEIRISSIGHSNLQWLGGFFGFYEETNLDHKNKNLSLNRLRSHHITKIETLGYAAFGQATYTVMEKLHFTLGLRLDNLHVEGKYRNRANSVSLKQDVDYMETLPKVSISYDIDNDVLAYATVAKGYLAGGFNWCMNPTQGTFNFDPEYSWNYEIGLKTTWLNNRILANLSLFYIIIDDKQVNTVDPTSQMNNITNAAQAYSYGGEIQFTAKPIAGLEIFANVGYNHAKFDQFISYGWNSDYTEVVSQDLSGKYLPYAPKYTLNVGVQYRWKNGFVSRVDVFGTGEFYGDPANDSQQDAYQLVNLRLGYESIHWEIYGWCKNLIDQEYLSYIRVSGNNHYAINGPPVTFGLSVAYRF